MLIDFLYTQTLWKYNSCIRPKLFKKAKILYNRLRGAVLQVCVCGWGDYQGLSSFRLRFCQNNFAISIWFWSSNFFNWNSRGKCSSFYSQIPTIFFKEKMTKSAVFIMFLEGFFSIKHLKIYVQKSRKDNLGITDVITSTK